MAQSINGNHRKSFNNAPLREGEVLVPMLVDDRNYALAIGSDPNNIRTHTIAGISFQIVYIPVPEAQEAACRKEYYTAVKELLDEKLGPNRFSRCLIPQPDGSYKLCPKIKNGNHAPCASCPHKGEYEKEERNLVSLDDLAEEEYNPMETAPSAESVSMEKFLLNDLLEYLGEINPSLAGVASLGFAGFSKKEVVQQLPVKSSQAYDLYRKAEQLTKEFLRK